ncbi:glycosyltransferase family 2 protein [Paenibacillus sp. JDR-2]|uniref:glycosyltransferase family 2 protein n=1 Tax=Paenibacillus sp. (strain JDR-2) TaxID=324057 RepID=UPI000166B9B7|nr:glycosyltransferase [Paenibacillus sp. JDR-2]ACT02471.1 glycosyl transferase family 2 [Paenibacillus sp. JDR-2]
MIVLPNQPFVSFVVLAYNHLEITKRCIDSLLLHTPLEDNELILVNNGSSDGTQAYFDSIPGARPVHLSRNVGPVNGFNVGMNAAQGKYIALISNDMILTSGWLPNLISCIESDPRIGFVSPGANYVSNFQQINLPFHTLEEMQLQAKAYNVSHPDKWEERIRLMPVILFSLTERLREIGGYDSRFYFGEFGDDDISYRYRRAGYKLVYAGDTFIFHHGSVTTGIDQQQNNSLQVSRQIFYNKYGIDSWAEGLPNMKLVDAVRSRWSPKESVSILAVNCCIGATPLAVKTFLKQQGARDVRLTSLSDQEKYLVDLRTVSDRTFYYETISDIKQLLGGEQFDYLIFEHGYPEFLRSFDGLTRYLLPSGQLIT